MGTCNPALASYTLASATTYIITGKTKFVFDQLENQRIIDSEHTVVKQSDQVNLYITEEATSAMFPVTTLTLPTSNCLLINDPYQGCRMAIDMTYTYSGCSQGRFFDTFSYYNFSMDINEVNATSNIDCKNCAYDKARGVWNFDDSPTPPWSSQSGSPASTIGMVWDDPCPMFPATAVFGALSSIGSKRRFHSFSESQQSNSSIHLCCLLTRLLMISSLLLQLGQYQSSDFLYLWRSSDDNSFWSGSHSRHISFFGQGLNGFIW